MKYSKYLVSAIVVVVIVSTILSPAMGMFRDRQLVSKIYLPIVKIPDDIVFIADTSSDIFKVSEDNSRLVQLIDMPSNIRDLSWSPSGNRVLFTSDYQGSMEVFIINPDGSNLQQLTDDFYLDYYAAWTSDGNRIVFISDQNGSKEFYKMNTDGSGVTKLTDLPQDPGYAIVSPDGTKIAFRMGQDDSSEIYSIDIDGTNLTRVTTNGVYDHPVQWSPDNTKLLTYSNSAFNYYFYLLINLNGDVLGQVNLFANPGGAAFSPDGAKIIYSDNSYGSPQMSFVYDVSSGNRTHLYCNDSDFYSLDFSWSSDSSKVVFPLMNAGMRVLHMNSGDCTVISVPGTPQTPKWMP